MSMSTAEVARNADTANLQTRNGYGIDIAANPSRAIERAHAAYHDLALWERHSVVPKHTLNAFNDLDVDVPSQNNINNTSIAIDSGCGTGLSTRLLHQILPDSTRIIGLDRSAIRLSKGINYHTRQNPQDNSNSSSSSSSSINNYQHQHEQEQARRYQRMDIVRADMEHFWRLAVHNSWAPCVSYQFFFYPNPYPLHLKRRIYGRPSFPYVVALGGRVEVRASWAGYLEEFLAAYSALANKYSTGTTFRATHIHPISHNNDIIVPISNFEKKFIDAKQPVYRLVIDTRPSADREYCPFRRSDDKLYVLNSRS